MRGKTIYKFEVCLEIWKIIFCTITYDIDTLWDWLIYFGMGSNNVFAIQRITGSTSGIVEAFV